jgi:hypothetical protein
VKPLSGGRSDARVVLTQYLDEIFPFAFSHAGKRTEQLVPSDSLISSGSCIMAKPRQLDRHAAVGSQGFW